MPELSISYRGSNYIIDFVESGSEIGSRKYLKSLLICVLQSPSWHQITLKKLSMSVIILTEVSQVTSSLRKKWLSSSILTSAVP